MRDGFQFTPMGSTPLARSPRRIWFYGLWLYIVAVSVHDAYWVVANRLSIRHDERNPLGQWLIELNAGDIWLFVAIKSAGTVLAAGLLLILFWQRPRIGWAVCCGVALFQSCLLSWLLFGSW